MERARIGRMIRILMKVRNVSVNDIAGLLGISAAQVYNRLNGKTDIAAHELRAIADRLDVNPGEFFRDPDDLVSPGSKWTPETLAGDPFAREELAMAN